MGIFSKTLEDLKQEAEKGKEALAEAKEREGITNSIGLHRRIFPFLRKVVGGLNDHRDEAIKTYEEAVPLIRLLKEYEQLLRKTSLGINPLETWSQAASQAKTDQLGYAIMKIEEAEKLAEEIVKETRKLLGDEHHLS